LIIGERSKSIYNKSNGGKAIAGYDQDHINYLIHLTNMRIAINDITVSYSDEGKDGAPVIIFIHGFPFNKSMWNLQIKALEDNYRVITYDIRGHGNSDAGEGDFTIELFVKDLLSLMDALKIEKTMLCGLSMGGYIALNAIENYPERFNAIILCDSNCIADTPEAKEKRMKAIENIRKNGVEKYADESIKDLFAPESFTTRKEEVAAVRAMIVKTTEQSLCNTLLALSVRKETCSKLTEIRVPVLIIVGKEDKITPPEAAHFMHEKIRNSSLSIIDHAGHLSNMENPDDFNTQLIKFIASVY
jgi:3-oxoadipate enol-lactonase